MTITFTQQDIINSTEIGWSGLNISDLVIHRPEAQLNESYLENLEKKLGLLKGVYSGYSKTLRKEFPDEINVYIQVLTTRCFRDVLQLLKFKLSEALELQYQYVISGGVPAARYREPETKELVEVSVHNYTKTIDGLDEILIIVSSTSPEIAKKMLANSVEERNSGEFSVSTKKIVEGLEDLTANAQPSGTIFWDPKTKGLIKISSGSYNFQLPECQIETTSELDINSVMTYLRHYLKSSKLCGE